MEPIARTARQILRRIVPGDAAALFELNADPEVIRHTGDPPFESVDAAVRFLASYDPYRVEGLGRWAALDAASGAFLGWCGLKRQEDGEVDLGYRYRRAVWGRGLATEASAACLDLAFGRFALASVVARASPVNVASLRVMDKLGFAAAMPYPGPGGEAWVQRRLLAESWQRSAGARGTAS